MRWAASRDASARREQQQADQDRDDRDNDEQLDEREPVTPRCTHGRTSVKGEQQLILQGLRSRALLSAFYRQPPHKQRKISTNSPSRRRAGTILSVRRPGALRLMD